MGWPKIEAAPRIGLHFDRVNKWRGRTRDWWIAFRRTARLLYTQSWLPELLCCQPTHSYLVDYKFKTAAADSIGRTNLSPWIKSRVARISPVPSFMAPYFSKTTKPLCYSARSYLLFENIFLICKQTRDCQRDRAFSIERFSEKAEASRARPVKRKRKRKMKNRCGGSAGARSESKRDHVRANVVAVAVMVESLAWKNLHRIAQLYSHRSNLLLLLRVNPRNIDLR